MAEPGAQDRERTPQREKPGSAALGREWGWGAGLARGAVGGAVEGGAGPGSPGTGRRVGAGPRGRGLGRLPATPSPGDPRLVRVDDPRRHQGRARPASSLLRCESRGQCRVRAPTPTPQQRRAPWERGCGPTQVGFPLETTDRGEGGMHSHPRSGSYWGRKLPPCPGRLERSSSSPQSCPLTLTLCRALPSLLHGHGSHMASLLHGHGPHLWGWDLGCVAPVVRPKEEKDKW